MSADQINGIQLNSKIGTNFDLMYGNIQGNDVSYAQKMTVKSDLFNNRFRASFQDTKSENLPQQMQNVATITNPNVGKKLDLSV